MLTKDFFFELPEELIAQSPSDRRGHDRLLVMDRHSGALRDCQFLDIVDLIEPGTVMVFNNSKVRRARLYPIADSSGTPAEFLLISALDAELTEWKAMVRNAKRHKPGRAYHFPDGTLIQIVEDPSGEFQGSEFRRIRFSRTVDDRWLEKWGHLPLPPYIKRDDGSIDTERYQTVYASTVGSVAAPTAGLHFTAEVLAALESRGVIRAEVTLHVGLGTFLPVRSEKIEDHRMHEEQFTISAECASLINQALAEGRPVLAVGTTSIRTLESAFDSTVGSVRAGEGRTSIFIYPGYQFKVVKSVFTNFHTPESTLLMLVSAFAGQEKIREAYQHAVHQRYRFFSYGDAMLIR